MPETENFDAITREYDDLIKQLGDPALISDWEKFEELSRRKSFLEKAIEKIQELKESDTKIEENQSIIASEEDTELVSLAESEISQLRSKRDALAKEISSMLMTTIRCSRCF